MSPWRKLLRVGVSVSLLLAGGCRMGPDFSPPTAGLPQSWPQTPGTSDKLDEQAGPDRWWQLFGDAELDSLIERAAVSNFDLRAASLHIAQARAEGEASAAAQWPSLSANGGYSRTRISESTATTSLLGLGGQTRTGASPAGGVGGSIPGLTNPFDQYQYGFDAGWEADLFGRVSRSVEAANASVLASREDRHAAFVAVAAEVARNSVMLRAALRQLQLSVDNLRTQNDILDLARQREQAGLGNALDVANAEATAATTESQLPVFRQQITLSISQIGMLLALPPEALRAELDRPAALPPAPAQVPLGLPSQLARRRPDIRAAEARLHSATAQIGVATASFYPELSLNLGIGMQAERFKDLADWASHFFSLGPALDIPLFDGGQRSATLHLRDAQQKEAALDYARTVLAALHEVEDAVAAFDAGRERNRSLSTASEQEEDALSLARLRYQSGVSGFLDVLEAERGLQQAQLAQVQNSAQVSSELVALFKALGGGWQQLPEEDPGSR